VPADIKARRCRTSGALAFTIVEVLAGLVIILILVVLIVPNYGHFLAKAEQAVCTSRMRTIHSALTTYLEDDRLVWPQGPPPEAPGWTEFWLERLSPYGVARKTWECPTLKKMLRDEGETAFSLHYVPTTFDATPNIAYRWPTQPWLIEAANAHGQGPLIAFPDGSIKPFFKVLDEQGLRP
jgi:type II secretory pathway pseudopilin PulG